MKKYIVSIYSILLLIIVNTSFFWENLPGIFDLIILGLTFIGFIVLLFISISQIIKGFKEKFKNQIRIINICISSIVLVLIYIFPFGFINFEKMIYDDNLLFTQYEGVANGTVSLKFKKDNIFIEKSVFFGVENNIGNYEIKNDTIFLIFKKSSNFGEEKSFCIEDKEFKDNLLYFRNFKDPLPLRMKVLEGNFNQLK
ncbi:hypothetical protein [Flavobacterium tibetense]|uniref:Uncharacterized protein n=1 Tax=Flavobacterium tibetense TaxID=2233533 RepID=A0A365P2Q2_9FLAO|nr:hypothetical protein [Flavobacterium tibetense]RBA28665.1 hypothetical protein DPN68_06540 [Flavobacterium tibetense]